MNTDDNIEKAAQPQSGEDNNGAIEDTINIIDRLIEEMRKENERLLSDISEVIGDHASKPDECVADKPTEAFSAEMRSAPQEGLAERLESVENAVRSIGEKQDRNDAKLTQTLRENANFQVQVRRGMQQDIDSYKEQLSGERFDGILKDIATIYVEYGSVLGDVSMEERTKKNLRSMFEQLEDILTDYGAEIVRSSEGEVRRTRVTKVINKETTDNEALHNTIAKSRKPGVVRDRVVLYPEFVDIYVYEPKSESEEKL